METRGPGLGPDWGGRAGAAVVHGHGSARAVVGAELARTARGVDQREPTGVDDRIEQPREQHLSNPLRLAPSRGRSSLKSRRRRTKRQRRAEGPGVANVLALPKELFGFLL